MAEQVRVQPSERRSETTDASSFGSKGAEQRAEAEKVKAETDALLDEIDDLLEEQGIDSEAAAQDFYTGFVQVGGE